MVVHHIRRPFRVDGRLIPGNPENLVGQKLEVGYWTVHGQEQRLADTIHVMSARPGRIVSTTAVPFARPRTLDDTFKPEFIEIVHALLKI